MNVFVVDSCIRGHHVSKSFWTSSIDETLSCEREEGNMYDPYAVSMFQSENARVVGHIPRKISAACSLFLCHEGNTITATVTGHRKFSEDLPQGGLEVPCKLTFRGNEKHVAKVRKLLPSRPSVTNYCLELPSKRRKTDDCTDELNDNEIEKEKSWVSLDKFVLTLRDKDCIESGDTLNDKHINFAQLLLKQQFQYIGGLASTLTLCRSHKLLQSQNALQIVHD